VTRRTVGDVVQSWATTWPNQVVPHGTLWMPNDSWVKILLGQEVRTSDLLGRQRFNNWALTIGLRVLLEFDTFLF
jgi:hypothetical protein